MMMMMMMMMMTMMIMMIIIMMMLMIIIMINYGLVRLKLSELLAVHDVQKRMLTFFCFTLSLILDNERWKQADVPSELQSLVDSLVDGKQYMNLRFSQVYMNSFSPFFFLEH